MYAPLQGLLWHESLNDDNGGEPARLGDQEELLVGLMATDSQLLKQVGAHGAAVLSLNERAKHHLIRTGAIVYLVAIVTAQLGRVLAVWRAEEAGELYLLAEASQLMRGDTLGDTLSDTLGNTHHTLPDTCGDTLYDTLGETRPTHRTLGDTLGTLSASQRTLGASQRALSRLPSTLGAAQLTRGATLGRLPSTLGAAQLTRGASQLTRGVTVATRDASQQTLVPSQSTLERGISTLSSVNVLREVGHEGEGGEGGDQLPPANHQPPKRLTEKEKAILVRPVPYIEAMRLVCGLF
jgi:hypothetical protein